MQIRTGVGEENGGAVGEGGGGVTPFFTPQHLAKTPTQSYFSALNSQDSLDQYHDACASLHRPPPSAPRKRHWSVGTPGRLPDTTVDLTALLLHHDVSLQPNGHTGSGVAVAGRARHASCTSPTSRPHLQQHPHSATTSPAPSHHLHSATRPPDPMYCAGTHHLGRLSLSVSSLKKKTDRDSPQKMEKLGGNCVDEAVGVVAPLLPSAPPLTPDLTNEAWRKNYVPCVETEERFGGGGARRRLEVEVEPGGKGPVVRTYTFSHVQPRRVGLRRVRDEFKAENLRLHHRFPHLFVSSQWQQHNRMSCLYLGYRIFWALYFTMWAVWAWVGSMGYDAPLSMKGYFLCYLTNWSIWALALDTSLQAVNVILHFKKISEDGEVMYPAMTRLLKASWVISNITGAVHLFITSAYWITVYPNRSDEKLTEIGVNTHIMPCLYVLLDVAVSAMPRRLLHAYQPSLYVIAYTFFNLLYYLCGGLDYMGRPALYPTIDWTRPGMTVVIMGAVILGLIPFLHALLCALYALRVKMWRILKISRYMREEDEADQVEGAEEKV